MAQRRLLCAEHNDEQHFDLHHVSVHAQRAQCSRCGTWVRGLGSALQNSSPALCRVCAAAENACEWCRLPLTQRQAVEAEFAHEAAAAVARHGGAPDTLTRDDFAGYLISRGCDPLNLHRLLRVRASHCA